MLQLAAKLHEILIVFFLSTLTISLSTRRLVESCLPFGLLTGAYRIGTIAYIFSYEFWKVVSGSFRGAVPPILFIAANSMIAALVGPASAILMAPAQDWFAFPDAFSGLQGSIFYNFDLNKTWPLVASVGEGGTVDTIHCSQMGGLYAEWCPTAGFVELWTWLSGWPSSQLESSVAFQEATGVLRRRLHVELKLALDGAVTFTSTISHPSALTGGRLLSYIDKRDAGAISQLRPDVKFKLTTAGTSPIYQLLVQTRCVPYGREELTRTGGLADFDATGI
ncbi:hypothetical protein OQA88_8694 [Cercophora sp. LCS_1]